MQFLNVPQATNLVMNYTETEAKVREATNEDPWGPSGQQMQGSTMHTVNAKFDNL